MNRTDGLRLIAENGHARNRCRLVVRRGDVDDVGVRRDGENREETLRIRFRAIRRRTGNGVDGRTRYELVSELRRRWLSWQRMHLARAATG